MLETDEGVQVRTPYHTNVRKISQFSGANPNIIARFGRITFKFGKSV